MDRSNIIRGPAIVEFNSQVFYVDGDIIVTPNLETFDVNASIFGKVDERFDDITVDISFTPAGQWLAGHLSTLWPYTNPTIGSSIFGATDKNVVIQTLAGQQLTWKAGAITQMPDLILSAGKTPIGQVTMKCIGTEDTAWTDTAKRAVIAAEAFADASFDPSDIITVPYTATLGAVASPWNDIKTEEGWVVSFDVQLEPQKIDSMGTIDMAIAGIGVMAKCTPVGITESQLLTMLNIQGSGVQRGASLGNNGNDLVITGGSGNPKITINNAAPKEAGFRFGTTTLRSGELGFVSVASFTTGARDAFFTIETAT